MYNRIRTRSSYSELVEYIALSLAVVNWFHCFSTYYIARGAYASHIQCLVLFTE